MPQIKILLLTESGGYGGNQTKILSILRNINRENFMVFAAAKGGGVFESEIQNLNVSFYNVELPKVLRTKYLKQIQNIYHSEKFDIVHSFGSSAGFYGRTLKKHHPEIKSIHSIHGIHYLFNANFFKKNASKSVEQYLVQYTDLTICENQNDFKIALENKLINPEKTVVINNGINISQFTNRKKNTELLYSLGLNENNFVIGNISRFEAQKNQSLIIQAAYYLVKKYPQLRFVLAGSGEQLKSMKEFASDAHLDNYIIFPGEIENTADYYSFFDLFVFPSFWDGMPYVLLEAMASRRSIICSKLANTMEIIKDNYSALTINPHNMDDLFQKILVLYQDKELSEKIAQNAIIESTQYDESEMVKKYEAVYSEVINR